MSERVLRGSRLGAVSYETDRGADLAPRQTVDYTCPRGHTMSVTFADDADVPVTWDCTSCGAPALLIHAVIPEQRQAKPQRTHWDMLLERRSVDELEELLGERLELLRAPGGRRSA
jgi:RNA polymerase-binding protein